MTRRYTARDCDAALIRYARHHNDATGESLAVGLTCKGTDREELEEFAENIRVRTCYAWDATHYRIFVDRCPSCYGGGVRPALCRAGSSSEGSPLWWKESAGLGPGALPRKDFCRVVDTATATLQMLDHLAALKRSS